jgi:hypothetical protein
MFAGNENSFSYRLQTGWNSRVDLKGSAGNIRDSTGRSWLRRLHDVTTTGTLRCSGNDALCEDG